MSSQDDHETDSQEQQPDTDLNQKTGRTTAKTGGGCLTGVVVLCLLAVLAWFFPVAQASVLPKLEERKGLFYKVDSEIPFSGTCSVNAALPPSWKIEGTNRDRTYVEYFCRWLGSRWFPRFEQVGEQQYKDGVLISERKFVKYPIITRLPNGPKKGDAELNIPILPPNAPILQTITAIFETIDGDQLVERNGKCYKVNSETPYTGNAIGSHPNGQKITEGAYKDGKKEGPWIVWYANGQKNGEGAYKDGKQEGAWNFWHEDGKKMSEGTLKDGKRDGIWKFKDPFAEYDYTYKDGVVIAERYLTPVDLRVVFEREGKAYFADSNLPFSGTAVGWHANGQKAMEVNYQDGKFEGQNILWHPNGQKAGEAIFKDGNPDGIHKSWHDNGTKNNEVTYKDGKREGIYTAWHENGKTRLEGTYKDGKEDGIWAEWYDNGQKESELTWKDGKKDGPILVWYPNGEKQIEGTWKDDKRVGIWTRWNKDGKKSWEGTFKDGELIKEENFDQQ